MQPFEKTTLAAKLQRVDFLGSATLALAIALLMTALDRGSMASSWSAPQPWAALGLSLLAGLAFLYVELRVAREPVVPPATVFGADLFPVYAAGFLCFFAIIGLDYVLPLFYQARLAMDAARASVYMIPAIAAGTASATACGLWMRRAGQYYWALVLSFALEAAGTLIAFLMSGPAAQDLRGLVVAQMVAEIGVGNAVVSSLIAVSKWSDGGNACVHPVLVHKISFMTC